LKKLAKYTTRQENVLEAFKREQKTTEKTGQPKVFNGNKAYNASRTNTGPSTQQAPAGTANKANNTSSTGPPNNGGNGTKKGKYTDRIIEEERDRLRAEGRRFTCKDVGHESRNCPERQTAKAPNLKAGSVKISEVENRGKAAREANLRVGAVGMTTEHETEGVRYQDWRFVLPVPWMIGRGRA
jgi:hypothetical protein